MACLMFTVISNGMVYANQAERAGQKFTVISNSLLTFFTEGKHDAEQQIKGETVTSLADNYRRVAGNVHCNQPAHCGLLFTVVGN